MMPTPQSPRRWLSCLVVGVSLSASPTLAKAPPTSETGPVPPTVGRTYTPPPAPPPSPPGLKALESQPPVAPSTPLSLNDLEALAGRNNPTLLQAQQQVRGELGKALQAGLWPNPTVGYIAEQIGVEGTVGEFQGGFVRQEIVTARKRAISREKYLQRTRVAEWLAIAQQYRVLNDVAIHYFRALGRQAQAKVHQQLLKNAEDNLLTVREMYNVGQATRAQVHHANVTLQRRRLDRLMAENDYRQSLEVLTSLVGVPHLCGPLADCLENASPCIDWTEALDRLLAESPELLAAHAKLQEDRITVRRERVEPIPNIVVQGAVGYNAEARQTVAGAQVSFQVPLWNRNQGTRQQALADFMRQEGEVRRVELRLRQELAREYRRYLTARQHVESFREVVLPEARKAYETLLKSYEARRVAWQEVLDAERNYFQLRDTYFRNLVEWRESEVLLRGFLLHGGLDAPSRPTPPGHIDSVAQPR